MSPAPSPDRSEEPAPAGLSWGLYEHSVGPVVRLLRNELTARIVDTNSHYGFRFGTLSTMVLMHANPGCSQTQLARELAMDKSMLVAICDDLEKRALAERRRSREDRRRNSLYLTEAGEQMMHEMAARAIEIERPIREGLTLEEVTTLVSLLRRAYGALIESEQG